MSCVFTPAFAHLSALAHLTLQLQQHVKLLDGTHTALGSSETLTFGIEPADLATGTVALRDVSNGALMGATMTMGQLFTGVASLIREKELAAEAAANQPAEVPAES